MAITTTCSGCGKTLAVADEFAGRQARCPACGQIYTIPAPATLTPIEPATPTPVPAPSDPSPSSSANSLDPFSFGSNEPLELNRTNSGNADAFASSDPFAQPSSGLPTNLQYWMKAGNGNVYGPVDSNTLARWFTEGRVGSDYLIRFGEEGQWQPAAAFQSIVTGPMDMSSSGQNPFAAPSAFTPRSTTGRSYPKADQSGLVLAMGILAWIGGCPIFGIIAWVVGAQALADMNANQADPSNRGVLQVGYYLGMANVILCVACGGLMLLGIALSAI